MQTEYFRSQFQATLTAMRFEYFPETDTLYIEFQAGPAADAQEVAPDIVLDFNGAGEVIGIEIEHASERTDLQNFQLSALPASTASQAREAANYGLIVRRP